MTALVGLHYGSDAHGVLVDAARLAVAHHRRLRLVHVVCEVDWLLDPRPVEQLLESAVQRAHAIVTARHPIRRSRTPVLDRQRRPAPIG